MATIPVRSEVQEAPRLAAFPDEFLDVWRAFFARKYNNVPPKARRVGLLRRKDNSDLVPALRRYQSEIGVTPSEEPTVDRFTLETALRDPEWPRVWITPGGPDLRHLRAYYMVPLLETAFPGEHSLLIKEIKEDVESRSSPITDVFVLSHGWHRNYFSGVTAYDRIISRLAILRSRGRLKADGNFQPLYIGLHWNSDPGEDEWVDKSGRRTKDSFLQNCRSMFELPDEQQLQRELDDALEQRLITQAEADAILGAGFDADGKFLTDFENAFELLTKLSTQGTKVDASENSGISRRLTSVLKYYRVRGMEPSFRKECLPKHWKAAAEAMLPYKVSTLWRCYSEAANKAFVTDQSEDAKPVGAPWTALLTIAKFVFGLGVISLTGILGKVRDLFASETVIGPVSKVWKPYSSSVLGWVETMLGRVTDPKDWNWRPLAETLLILLTVMAACFLVLGISWLTRRVLGSRRSPRSFPLFTALAWLPLQIIFMVPIVVTLLATWIFRTPWVLLALAVMAIPDYFGFSFRPMAWYLAGGCLLYASIAYLLGLPAPGVFKERLNFRSDRALLLRDHLAAIARLPINIVKNVVGKDSRLFDMACALENQVAFFQLQRKGVDAGQDAGRFMRHLLTEVEGLQSARLHIAGHSFGGLVILNCIRDLIGSTKDGKKPGAGITYAARKEARVRRLKSHYSYRPSSSKLAKEPLPNLHSLTLIQAAVGSDWFRNELKLVRSICHIACIYSGYDTANGFWYPLANNGRKALGYVGMCDIPEGSGRFTPRALGHDGEFAMLVRPPKLHQDRFYNIDASRIIFEGPVATGGGHNDIFKDDIVNLLWAVATQPPCLLQRQAMHSPALDELEDLERDVPPFGEGLQPDLRAAAEEAPQSAKN